LSSQTQLTVCNLSLLSIGARTQISSVNPSDGSTAADACSTLFQFVFEAYARAAKWGCLKKQFPLTLIQAASGTPENLSGTTLPIPQQPWLYAYSYPADCLYMREILCPINPTSSGTTPQLTISNNFAPIIPGQEMIAYQIGYSVDSNNNPIEVVLTNQEAAVANYTVNQPNPASWDSLFTSGFVAALAVYLAPALSLNTPLMASCKQQAESIIAQARAKDGNESPVSQDHVPDWVRARSGATGYTLWSPTKYNAYGNIAWPG